MADTYEKIKEKAAEALALIDLSEPLGTTLFDAVARITPMVAIETVAIRERIRDRRKETEVFLTKRAPNDSTFPGHWHSPGSCLRGGESVEDVFRRLEKKEFHTTFIEEPCWFGEWNNPDGDPRGHTFHAMYLAKVETSFSNENWFAIDKLPEPMISYHEKVIIPRAVAAFQSPRTDLPFAIVPVDLRYTETELRDRFVRPKNVTVLLMKNEQGKWDCPIRTWDLHSETEHEVLHPRYRGASNFDVRDYVGACFSLVRGKLRWCRIYLCRRSDEKDNPEGGQFFLVNNLPELISKDAKEKFIPAAVGHLNLLVAGID